MAEELSVRISVQADGPYLVTGRIPLMRQSIAANADGESVGYTRAEALGAGRGYYLCRCGHSQKKPYCDGSHETVKFDGAETAAHASYAEQAGEIEGPALVLDDAEPLCAFARFCDRDGKVWNTVTTAVSPADQARFSAQVGQCPSGRLVARDARTGAPIEPDLAASIVVLADPQQGVGGPLFVRGGVEVVGADGVAYETRNRVTLCRCGVSKNKPFCDGSHASVGFTDT